MCPEGRRNTPPLGQSLSGRANPRSHCRPGGLLRWRDYWTSRLTVERLSRAIMAQIAANIASRTADIELDLSIP